MKVTVKNKQSLMDITVENYGQIDNLVSVSNDNDKSISEALETNQELTVNSENAGDQEIKDKITTQGLSFNNDFKPSAYNFSLWFLPSLDEAEQMLINLADYGVGGFASNYYWTSSEFDNNEAWKQRMVTGAFEQIQDNKAGLYFVRACRTFNDAIGAYNLRDIGEAGGLIFYINGTTYYEAAPGDQSSPTNIWSNVATTLLGATGTAIGTGAQNTLDIINQVGHTASAAKLCNDLN